MSCNAKGKKCINAAKRNGIWGLANGYLGTLGSWATWRDTNDVDDITGRLGQVTAAYFGISMRGGVPKLASRALVAMPRPSCWRTTTPHCWRSLEWPVA